MDSSSILHRLDVERRTLERAGDVLTSLPAVTRICSTEHTRHQIAWSSHDERAIEQAIDAEIEHHRQLGMPFEWKVYSHDQPTDLLGRLRRRGFSIGPKEAVCVCELSETDWIQTSGPCTVERIDRLEQLEDFKETAGSIFGKDYSMTTQELAEAVSAGSKEHLGYIAYAEATDSITSAKAERSIRVPVAVGRLYTHPQSWFGGLYGGGTLPDYRGRGFYRATVAARARDAMALGAKYLIIDALPTSRPIVERLGFVQIAETWPAEWK